MLVFCLFSSAVFGIFSLENLLKIHIKLDQNRKNGIDIFFAVHDFLRINLIQNHSIMSV